MSRQINRILACTLTSILAGTSGFFAAPLWAGTLSLDNQSQCKLSKQYTHQIGMKHFDFPNVIELDQQVDILLEQQSNYFQSGVNYKGMVEYAIMCDEDFEGVLEIRAEAILINDIAYLKLTKELNPKDVMRTIPHSSNMGELAANEKTKLVILPGLTTKNQNTESESSSEPASRSESDASSEPEHESQIDSGATENDD